MSPYFRYLFILLLTNGISLGYLYQFYQEKINNIRLELKGQRERNQLLRKKLQANHPTIQNILSDTHQRTTLLLKKMKTIDLSELDNQFIHSIKISCNHVIHILEKGKKVTFKDEGLDDLSDDSFQSVDSIRY
tara:strand:- start:3718 stop:4116 length:399 start_codon:yes stop_codon:yes gene_type:complete